MLWLCGSLGVERRIGLFPFVFGALYTIFFVVRFERSVWLNKFLVELSTLGLAVIAFVAHISVYPLISETAHSHPSPYQ